MPSHLAGNVILFTRQPLEASDSHMVEQQGVLKSQLTFNKRRSGPPAKSLRVPESADW